MNAFDDNDDGNDDDKAFLGRPESANSNGRFAHVDIWRQSIKKKKHQHICNIKVPETSMCGNVLHILDTPLQELSCGGQR